MNDKSKLPSWWDFNLDILANETEFPVFKSHMTRLPVKPFTLEEYLSMPGTQPSSYPANCIGKSIKIKVLNVYTIINAEDNHVLTNLQPITHDEPPKAPKPSDLLLRLLSQVTSTSPKEYKIHEPFKSQGLWIWRRDPEI